MICIYALTDPDTGTLRYIGQSKNPRRRWWVHITPCNLRDKSHKNNWIKSLRGRNKRPGMIVLTTVDNENADIAERAYIAACRMMGFNLVNGTDGGQNMYKRTKESNRKLSQSLMGHVGYWKGKKRSRATRKRMSKAHHGEHNSNAKLTDVKATEIRTSWDKGYVSYPSFVRLTSKRYDVSTMTIRDIIQGRTWKRLPFCERPVQIERALSRTEVIEARRLYATGKYTYTALSKHFNVSLNAMSDAIRGDTWADTPGAIPSTRKGKLSDTQKEEIRRLYNIKTRLYAHSGASWATTMSKQLGVSKDTIYGVIRKGKGQQVRRPQEIEMSTSVRNKLDRDLTFRDRLIIQIVGTRSGSLLGPSGVMKRADAIIEAIDKENAAVPLTNQNLSSIHPRSI